MLSHLNFKHFKMLSKLFRHTYHKAQGYIRPVPNLHSRNFTIAMQDPDSTSAFCHHNKTDVSFNSTKLEEKYRPTYYNELNATNE